LTRLETVFAALPLPEGSVVALADRRNLIIARSIESEKYIGSTFQTPKDPKPTSFQMDEDGIPRFHGTATIERGPWLLSVAIPRTEVIRRLAPLWRRNLSIMAVVLAFVIALTSWLSWRTAFDLRRLQDAARQIASGDLRPPEQKPVHNREMDQLQSSFVTMAEKLRDARDSLEQQFEQERKMREALETLQRQVVRQERLAAVGLLVSGVAHELNNPLQSILGTVELIEREPGLPDSVSESISFVKAQSVRANDIIRSLARFGRDRGGTPSGVDLRDVIAEVLQLRKRELAAKSIAVEIETSSIRSVFAVFSELEQVVLNFVVNAQQAIEEAGKPQGRIRIRLTDVARGVRLEVSDDGPGVRAEDEPKLFQPFFTTRSVGYGIGLGLSVSYGIIEAYGGTTGYARNEWGGATFFVELPAQPGEMQATNDGSALLHRRVSPGI
jgi:two-component system NtrC family sensor kinase